MRVLLCHQPIDGGVGRHIRDLTDGLGAKGYEVILCSQGTLGGLIEAARVAVVDRRDLHVWAHALRAQRA